MLFQARKHQQAKQKHVKFFELNSEWWTKIALRGFKREKSYSRLVLRELLSRPWKHCHFNWKGFNLLGCFKLQNEPSFWSVSPSLWACQQLRGYRGLGWLLLLLLMEELVQTNTTWLLLNYTGSVFQWPIPTFRKVAKAGPKLVCVLVRSLIHPGSLPSVAGREYRRSHSTMEE